MWCISDLFSEGLYSNPGSSLMSPTESPQTEASPQVTHPLSSFTDVFLFSEGLYSNPGSSLMSPTESPQTEASPHVTHPLSSLMYFCFQKDFIVTQAAP